MAVAIGLVVGICALMITLLMGSKDSGQNFIPEQNLGVQYRETWTQSQTKSIGVSKFFGVPIWDNAQGIGSRMPNLITQPTQSPVVFLGEKLPVEFIVFLRNLLAMLSALVVLNLTVLSWSDRRINRRLIFMNVALLGPYFLFTTQLDWFVIADQYWGGCLILAGLLHKRWYQTSSGINSSAYSSTILFAFIFGLSSLMVGQIMYIPLVVIAGASYFLFNLLYLKKILGPTALVLIFLLIFVLSIPNIIELSSQVWSAKSIAHSSQPSIFDVFQPQQLRVYRFQPLVAFVSGSVQPILSVINYAGPRTEFLGLLFLPFILQSFKKLREINSPQSRILRVSVISLIFIFFNLTFSGSLARSGLPIISTVFDFHVWELSHFFLLLVFFLATISLGFDQKNNLASRFVRIGNRLIMAIAIIVALMYPLVMVMKEAPRWNPQQSDIGLSKDFFDARHELYGFVKSYRSIVLDLESINVDDALNIMMVRAGYPLLNSVIYGRSSGTLRTTEQRFRSVHNPSILDCQPEVLDLLAVDAIVFESAEDDVCSKNLTNYYRSSDEISFINVPGSSSVVTAKPKQFSSWSINTNLESNPVEPCPLFEKDCLNGLTVTKLDPNSGAPFKLCEDKCVFTYRWSAPSSSMQVLVPENYDKTIQIKDLSTGMKLKTANYQGLLAVEIPSGVSSGMFEATIKPDAMMWARVSATYIHTLILLSTLILISVRGVRARKERSDAVIVA